MKDIYVAVNKENTAILFSKKMVNKYLKFFPNAKFETVSNLQTAFQKAKPDNYFSLKVYAVKQGNICGMCLTKEEYDIFFRGASHSMAKKCSDIYMGFKYIYKTIPKSFTETIAVIDKPINAVYTDGSYLGSKNLMGMSYEIHSERGLFSHSSFIEIATAEGSSTKAELIATMMATQRAIKEGLKEITIIHDNSSVYDFAIKSPKNDFGKKYHNFIQNNSKNISINFQKVRAHSGNENNVKVDKLARHENIDKFIEMI